MALPFSLSELNEQITLGYVKATEHPEFPLTIYNYTNKCQYDSAWNNVTNHCRGLILDKEFNIVARPFRKFHNWSEHVGQGKEIPDGHIEVTEKMDGSLGILYYWDGEPYIATRGSFASDQALEGTKIFREWVASHSQINIEGFTSMLTFLFEIIYPQNRIVVNYGIRRELVLLAVIDNQDGSEVRKPDWYLPHVKHHEYKSIEEVFEADQEANREGFVIRFRKNNLRLKVKFDEYVRLHRLLTQTSARDIWDLLRNNKEIDELLELVPDEFYTWVQSVVDRLREQWSAIHMQAGIDFQNRPEGDRKTIALYFQTCEYPGLLFLLLDEKYDRLNEQIWKMIRPAHEIPFVIEV